ncbi:MAG: Fe-S cluster assembly transcriptional regulator IscR [Gammaproteobacteria bacterium]|nr:MAG: Fe-S cluster assembly transcriptional regulator IscR [Gammaproteobacteria bacterium]
MRLTTKGRYAVTAMLDLTLHREEGPVALADISRRQDISLSYLEQLFARLRKQGLVESVRGPGGGYRLAMNPDDITISQVIAASDEKVDATRCGGKANCHGNHQCLTHELWTGLSDQIRQFLDSITLGQLVKKHTVKEISKRQDRSQTLHRYTA